MAEKERIVSGAARRVFLLVLLRICNWTCFLIERSYTVLCPISISTLLTYVVLRSVPADHRRCWCLPAFVAAFLQVAIIFEVMDCFERDASGLPVERLPSRSPRAVEMMRRNSIVNRLGELTRHSEAEPEEPEADSFMDMMHTVSIVARTPRGASHTAGASRIPRPSFLRRKKERLHLVRKLMVATMPEAAYSSVFILWQLLKGAELLKWYKGPKCNGKPEGKGNRRVEESEFDKWFKESEHGIIRRQCEKCTKDHQIVFYRRNKHAEEVRKGKVFHPYRYMMLNWSQEAVNNGPTNKLHEDFDLFSTYEDAVLGSVDKRWTVCTTWSTQGKPIGFPGDCGEKEAVTEKPQYSTIRNNSHDWCNYIEGQKVFSYRVERSWWATMVDLPKFKNLSRAIFLIFMMVVAAATYSIILGDIVVWIWIQTDFVKEYSHLVIFFYFLETCSWTPILVLFAHYQYTLHEETYTVPYVTANLFAICLSIVLGFYVKPARSLGITGRQLFSQVIFSACLTPFVFFTNFLFFDRSLTFKPFNRAYYPVRYCFIACFIYLMPSLRTHPATVIALLASTVQAVMVWVVIPQKRRQHENLVRESALDRMEEMSTSTMHYLPNPEALAFSGEAPNYMIDVLNTVGDTFEALLLASKTDSPRVRQAVLRVAVEPLSQANPEVLRQLLPLILPQLLLALRWRTVEEGEDEHCPLSHFIIDRVLASGSTELVTLVYWDLLALATDRRQESFETYRSVRERFLLVLESKTFHGKIYEEEFCNSTLTLLANQGRLYSQLRSVARWCGQQVQGSTVQKTEFLQSTCLSPSVRSVWQGKQLLAPKRECPRDISTATGYTEANLRNRVQLTRKQLCQAAIRGCCWKCLRSAIRICLCRACSCCPCYRKSTRKKRDDFVKEEWEKDYVLWDYENVDLDLIEPQNTSLPVDPADLIVGVDERKSFVAHSAVAPVVICCRMAGPDADRKRMFALKNGDDLRQDALILQIFKLMEKVWEENKLAECVLKPYNVLPVTPTEGIVAFVPKSEKVSSVLFEYDGDFVKFITNRCPTDKERGFDLLCGSTAGYCVATFVLGIGDRHLDNLMITEDGRFFHIDFGFVFGDDPKPCAPAVRVPREIVDAIKTTGRYEHFVHLVGEAYSLLRRTPRLWSALLGLTREAGGNGVDALKEHGVEMVLERLHLELDDNAARMHIINEVESSAASGVPIIFDKIHQVGLFWH